MQVYLGEIPPETVQVQLYADPLRGETAHPRVLRCKSDIPGTTHGYVYRCDVDTYRPAAHFTPRAVALTLRCGCRPS